jgi:hypothetical protein
MLTGPKRFAPARGRYSFPVWLLLITGCSVGWQGVRAEAPAPASPSGTTREAGHEVLALPFYSVFHNLSFHINGGVTLLGQVTSQRLKSDADKAVKQIEGILRVTETTPGTLLADVKKPGFLERAGDGSFQAHVSILNGSSASRALTPGHGHHDDKT